MTKTTRSCQARVNAKATAKAEAEIAAGRRAFERLTVDVNGALCFDHAELEIATSADLLAASRYARRFDFATAEILEAAAARAQDQGR